MLDSSFTRFAVAWAPVDLAGPLATLVHVEIDHYLQIERGETMFIFDDGERVVPQGAGVMVSAGTRHNASNASCTESGRLYAIRSPSSHPDQKTLRRTKATAAAAVHH